MFSMCDCVVLWGFIQKTGIIINLCKFMNKFNKMTEGRKHNTMSLLYFTAADTQFSFRFIRSLLITAFIAAEESK